MLVDALIKRGELREARSVMQANRSHHPALAKPIKEIGDVIANNPPAIKH
jgi:hypothetical protein